jgi:putative tryptophan/tyrosine transport system substrate-binding protein
MKRRDFVALAVGALGAPLVRAQQPGRQYRIGILGVASPIPEVLKDSLQPFHLGMRELGWVDGTHYVTEVRWAEGRPERFPVLAQELVRSKPDVLIAVQTGPIRALMQATRTIPIVMVGPGEPVASGLVASLARPGANVTGLAFDIDLGTHLKQIDYLRQIVPNLALVAVLVNPAAQAPQVATLLAAIGATGLKASLEGARTPDEIEPAFVRMRDSGVQAAIVQVDGMLFLNQSRLSEMGLRYRIALGSGLSSLVRAGGLISYAPEIGENWRRSATYIHRILRGAKPADLPVELPSRIKLTINMKTAKALGLKVPQSVLLGADEIIE